MRISKDYERDDPISRLVEKVIKPARHGYQKKRATVRGSINDQTTKSKRTARRSLKSVGKYGIRKHGERNV